MATQTNVRAQNLAQRLNQEHAKNRSWRTIASNDFPPIVKAGTLNSIAKSNGKWIPKNKKIREALGLIPPPPPEWLRRIRRRIAVMARQTRQDLGLQK